MERIGFEVCDNPLLIVQHQIQHDCYHGHDHQGAQDVLLLDRQFAVQQSVDLEQQQWKLVSVATQFSQGFCVNHPLKAIIITILPTVILLNIHFRFLILFLLMIIILL